jgi:hypothetical protein
MQDARNFFGPSIDFGDVTIKDSSVALGGRAWTCNNVIRFPKPKNGADCPATATLIHELAHVWEHQDGQLQLLKGAVEQAAHSLTFGKYNPYDYGGAACVNTAQDLRDFNKESQARIIEDYWRSVNGQGEPPGSTYGQDLQRLVQGAGIGTIAPRGISAASAVDAVAAGVVNLVLRLFGQ